MGTWGDTRLCYTQLLYVRLVVGQPPSGLMVAQGLATHRANLILELLKYLGNQTLTYHQAGQWWGTCRA
jgi:hypothetical protein